MNRRDFLLKSSAAAALTLAGRSKLFSQTATPSTAAVSGASPAPAAAAAGPAANQPPTVTAFKALRGGTGIFTGRGGTIGYLSNKDALVVIDAQFPDTAAVCLAGLPDRGQRQIDFLINTHHHGDHTSGNIVFKPVTKTIVAQNNVPKLQFDAAEKAGKLNDQIYADTTFPDSWRHDFGSEVISAQYYGPAHTKGDIVVLFEKANVVHMGDLMFNRMYPVIDRPGGARILGWIRILEDIVKTYPRDAIYIFGHGNPKFGVTGGHADILVMRKYLNALLAHVRKEISAGKTKEQIVALENFPGFPDFHLPLPNRLGMNLSVAYDELMDKTT